MSTTGVRWRYLRLLMGEDANITRLDALGDQGWELVCRNLVSGQIGVYEWLFKRMVVQWTLPDVPADSVTTSGWRAPEAVRDEGLQRVDGMVERTRKGWSEEARARARETRERKRQMQQMKALAGVTQDTTHDAAGNT